MPAYSQILAGLAILFMALERIWPRVAKQGVFRKGWLSDAGYVVFNSKYSGILLGYVTAVWIGRLNGVLPSGWLRNWPWEAQFAALLIIVDLLKWCVHNLLHRVPWLWEFHKVHHSIVEMDWMGDWRFHWVETIVYNSLLYVPTVCLGAPGGVGLGVGVVDTIIGHFAHANLRWRIGWLKYVINSPEMHLWHHNHPESGPVNRNFGLTLSVWDWIFGTAYLPAHNPERLGFEGVERYPASLPAQWAAPFAALAGWRGGPRPGGSIGSQ